MPPFVLTILLGVFSAWWFSLPLSAQSNGGSGAAAGMSLDQAVIISILVGLLQQTNSARVAEFRSSQQRIEEVYQAQLARETDWRNEHRAYVERILAAYERKIEETVEVEERSILETHQGTGLQR